MIGATAKPQLTEEQLKAHLRRAAFHQSIADKAAALKEQKQGAHQPRFAAPEAVPARVDPPAQVATIETPALPFAPMKKPWFRIEGATAPPTPRVSEIQEAVCVAFSIQMVDMKSARRTANLVRPRQVAMYLAKTMTGKSLPEIGRCFGGRDHTTVLHALRKIEAKVEFNAGAPELFDAELSDLIKSLRSNIEARRGE